MTRSVTLAVRSASFRSVARAALAALAAGPMLAGCLTLEPKYARPAPPVPSSFPQGGAYAAQAAGADASKVRWDAFFTDPKLQAVVRLALAQKFEAKHKLFEKTGTAADFKFLWVTDFPFFEWDDDAKTWAAAHHPFTSPHDDDMKAGRLTSDPGAVRALAYDIVLNGTELGSGSIRIHRQDVQQEIFRALGMTDEEARERFGFFLDALTYGTPPHGGIALGLDRIAMILSGASSLREVIAFPKTAKAIDLMVNAPTPATEKQLKELHLRTVLKG